MKQETFQKQAPIAVIAIMGHAIASQLPIDNAHISIDRHDQKIDVVLFGLTAEDHAQWLASLHVEVDESEVTHPSGRARTTWKASLPDTGIRFTLVTYHAAATLSVVSA